MGTTKNKMHVPQSRLGTREPELCLGAYGILCGEQREQGSAGLRSPTVFRAQQARGRGADWQAHLLLVSSCCLKFSISQARNCSLRTLGHATSSRETCLCQRVSTASQEAGNIKHNELLTLELSLHSCKDPHKGKSIKSSPFLLVPSDHGQTSTVHELTPRTAYNRTGC